MKPPKAFRGVVNTLFGINNKKPTGSREGTKCPAASSPSLPPARTSFDDLEVIERRRTASHREEFHHPVPKAQTLSRRTKSHASEASTPPQEPFDHRRESRLASLSRTTPQPIEFENHKKVIDMSFSHRALSLPTNGSSNPEAFFNRRSVSTSSAQGQPRRRSQELILSDYDEKIQFTNSSNFSKSNSPGCKNNAVSKDPKPQHRMSPEINNNEKPLPKQNASAHGSTDKLVSCLDALDRLSQQVKRINEVSEKVKKVEKYSQHDPKKERHLRELNMAAAASMRIKSLIKSEFDRSEDGGSRHSSQSSGYASDSSRRNSTSPTNTRQPSIDKLYKDIRQSSNTLPPIRRSQMDLSYPRSVQDMMPIWDEKSRQKIAYEGSVSSGYMTGSSSEEDQRITPPMEPYNNNVRYQQNQNWNHQQQHQQRYPAHPQQHQGYYPGYQYDPNYEYYGMYGQQYDGSVSGDSGNHDDDMYGYYGYASSSIQDGDLYAGNGWYRLPSVPGRRPEEVAPSQQQMVEVGYQQQQNWPTPQDNNVHKYGGLAGLFYDPNTNLSAPMMPPLAYDNRDDTSSVCSFNYGGNVRSLPSKNMSKTSKKTVRFSQTVRHRVETEESEMEDSTGVIKACRDEGNDKILTKKDLEKQQQNFENNSNQSIYYWPQGMHVNPQIQQQLNYY